jgi:hypothetical protein
MSNDLGWQPVLEINSNLLRAALGFGLGWLAWQLHSPDFFYFGFVAAMCVVGGVIRLVKGLWGILCLIKRQRKLSGYRRKGTTPKADRVAGDDDLRKAGLLK